MKRLTLTLGVAAMLAAASPALAQVPLAEEAHINDSLRAGRIGDVIRNTCPTISARMFVVLMKIEDLKRYALDQGYSRDEVEEFIKNKDQKNRLKAEAAAYLAEAGAVEGDAESYCKVGRDEIAKGSLIGELLRSSE
jgi:nucleotide-binding universal stress UspA family protein